MNLHTTLEIGEDTINLHFGMLSLRMFSDKLKAGKVLMEGQDINELGIATILHGGYVNYCEIHEQPQKLKFADFAIYVEGVYLGQSELKPLTDVINFWAECRSVKTIAEAGKEIADDAKKKGLVGKKSKK